MLTEFKSDAVHVTRLEGDKPACSESHFFAMLRDQFNSDRKLNGVQGRWRKVRPDHGGYGLTSMPYALHMYGSALYRRPMQMIGDGQYMLRLAHEDYNNGTTVRLTRY